MAFWKKGEDPWDRDPSERRSYPTAEYTETEPADEEPGLLEELRAWNRQRKAKEEELPPPVACPWCGKEMTLGYISGGKTLWWTAGRCGTKAKLIGSDPKRSLDLNAGVFSTWTDAWYCPDCKKIVVDAAKAVPPYGDTLLETAEERGEE